MGIPGSRLLYTRIYSHIYTCTYTHIPTPFTHVIPSAHIWQYTGFDKVEETAAKLNNNKVSLSPTVPNLLYITALLCCSNGKSLRGPATKWLLLEVTRSFYRLLSGILQTQILRESLRVYMRWETTGSGCVTKNGLSVCKMSGISLLFEGEKLLCRNKNCVNFFSYSLELWLSGVNIGELAN